MRQFLIVAALAVSASAASAQAVAVTLTEWKVALSRDTVRAGTVSFRVNNGGTVSHAFYVRGDGVEKGTKEIPVRQSASLTVTLKPGTYEVFCSMSDDSHKLAGMKQMLVVIPSDTSAPKKPEG